MKFKVGDRVLVRAPSWTEKCIVVQMGFGEDIMFVRRADGRKCAIFKKWASKITKNQQLLFDFYV